MLSLLRFALVLTIANEAASATTIIWSCQAVAYQRLPAIRYTLRDWRYQTVVEAPDGYRLLIVTYRAEAAGWRPGSPPEKIRIWNEEPALCPMHEGVPLRPVGPISDWYRLDPIASHPESMTIGRPQPSTLRDDPEASSITHLAHAYLLPDGLDRCTVRLPDGDQEVVVKSAEPPTIPDFIAVTVESSSPIATEEVADTFTRHYSPDRDRNSRQVWGTARSIPPDFVLHRLDLRITMLQATTPHRPDWCGWGCAEFALRDANGAFHPALYHREDAAYRWSLDGDYRGHEFLSGGHQRLTVIVALPQDCPGGTLCYEGTPLAPVHCTPAATP